MTKNEDGSYSILVNRGGDLVLELVVKKEKEEKKPVRRTPGIRVEAEKDQPLSAGQATLNGTVKCSNMDFAIDQFMSAGFILDGQAKEAKYFTVHLDHDGKLTVTIAEELLSTLEAGEHVLLMRLPVGRTIKFTFTLA